MTYSSGGLIQATDYNGFVSTNGSNINGVWNTAYGQGSLATVSAGATVTATQWATLNSTLTSIANHQGTAITSRTTPTAGNTIAILANLSTDITSVSTNQYNAGNLGTQYTGWTGTASRTSSTGNGTGYWTLFFSDTVTFANSTAATNFFNSGGLVKVQFNKSSTGNTGDSAWNTLAGAVGTIYLSSTGASKTLGGTSYTGTTKSGGSGSPTTLATGTGFAQLSTGNTTIFKQFNTGGNSNDYIQINALFSGSTLTLYTDWYSNVGTGTISGGTASSGTSLGTAPTTVVTYYAPETTYLTNVWGTPTVASTLSVTEGPNPVTVPGAPTIGTATATSSSTATVSFTAPSSNGGATITSYTATSSPGGITGTLSQAGSGTITVSGLTDNTTYTFTVTATNSVGTSSASAASNSITTPSAATCATFNSGTGLYSWVCPSGVTSVSMFMVGGGANPGCSKTYFFSNYCDCNKEYCSGSYTFSGGGGGGGAGAYRNNVAVTPGVTYKVTVGPYYGGGYTSYAFNSAFAQCNQDGLQVPGGRCGVQGGGCFTGGKGGGRCNPAPQNLGTGAWSKGGNGGDGAGGTCQPVPNKSGAGGGGAGGYGECGSDVSSGSPGGQGGLFVGAPGNNAGSGGGGSGGGTSNAGVRGGGGGGVGLNGRGNNAAPISGQAGVGGNGGSGGQAGQASNGGLYGGGGGSASVFGGGKGSGARGAVRIVWPGTTRAFPTTNVS